MIFGNSLLCDLVVSLYLVLWKGLGRLIRLGLIGDLSECFIAFPGDLLAI